MPVFKLSTILFFVLIGFSACETETQQAIKAIREPATTLVQSSNNSLNKIEKEAGWQLLFDGKSTDQWRGYNQPTFPRKGWEIDDEGNLQVSASGTDQAGFGGDIVTKEQFENFELKIDFMVTDTGNSGIFYRVVEEEKAAIWFNAPEFQILDNQTYVDLEKMDMHTHLTGDNYDLHPSKGDYSRPVGSWNTAHIIVNNNEVEHWLNGQQTVKYTLETPEWEQLVKASKFANYPQYGRTKNGYIGLQDHGHLVKFRNMKIKRL